MNPSETALLDRRRGSDLLAHSGHPARDSIHRPMLTEPHITSLLGRLLRGMSPRWAGQGLRIQETQVFDGAPAASPDLLVHPRGSSPVVVEAKYEGSESALERQAQERLSLTVGGAPVETVMMLVYPAGWADESDESVLQQMGSTEACLRWATLSESGRMPSTGWAHAGLREVADLLEMSNVSAIRVREAATELSNAIRIAGAMIDGTANAKRIARILRQHHDPDATSEQSSRMAAMLMLNAFIFQQVLSEQIDGLPALESVRVMSLLRPDGTSETYPTISEVRNIWVQIQFQNWWPIFDIAEQLVMDIPPSQSMRLLHHLVNAAQKMTGANLDSLQDIAGQMFGKLVTDRDLLKAHYTRVEAAALLAELGVALMDDDVYKDPDRVKELRIADFACGTGMLLSSVYRRIISRVRRAGIDDRELHPAMLGQVFTGLDVLPSAVHLTAMALSSIHPDVIYKDADIHLVPFGCESDGNGKTTVHLGALDLLEDKADTLSLFGKRSDRRMIAIHDGTDVENDLRDDRNDYLVKVDVGSCDLVIMNPPYGRATKHSRKGAKHQGATKELIPPFAAFGASPDDQREMSNRLSRLSKQVAKGAGHGNVGLASYFFDIAHAKLSHGGVLAIVLPLTAATGKGWGGLRRLITSHYDNITFIGLAGATDEERQFSADTGIAELLLVAKRRPTPRTKMSLRPDIRWVTLYRRPQSELEGILDARLVAASHPAVGETEHLRFGGEAKGRVVTGRIGDGGLLAIRSDAVIALAVGLANGTVDLRRHPPLSFPFATFRELGQRCPYHLDVATLRGSQGSETERAPFFVDTAGAPGTDTFPLLWAHDSVSGRESRLEVVPDSAGTPRSGQEVKARELFREHAVRFHLNQDFDFGSQMLAACITPEKVLGGTAWPGYRLDNPDHEKFLTLWMNTTLGLIAFWLTGSRQQKRRSRISVTRQHLIPVYDPRTLAADQLTLASEIYGQTKGREFKPANRAHADANRHDLDRAVLCDLLGLHTEGGLSVEEFMDSLGRVRSAWCEEPHIKQR